MRSFAAPVLLSFALCIYGVHGTAAEDISDRSGGLGYSAHVALNTSTKTLSLGDFSTAASEFDLSPSFDALGREIRCLVPSDGNRTSFEESTLEHVSSLGLNVVVAHPPQRSKGIGYERSYLIDLRKGARDLQYKVYVARRSKLMQVTYEDGGHLGRWWVQWGRTVKFHNYWHPKGMGTPYEVRPKQRFPPF